MKQKVHPRPTHQWRAFTIIGCSFIYSVALILVSAAAVGQAQLIRDVNRTEDDLYPEYADLVPGDNTLFFTSQRKELWNTNGTTAGTVLYKKFNALSDLLWTGTALYFVGETDGRELWKSTGPGSATVRVKNIRAGAAGSDPKHLTNVNGIVYFTADDGVNGYELWKSDGTTAGTVLVKDIYPGATGSDPSQLTNVNGILYFVADDSQHGIELWRSDGTAAGTMMVEDINPGEYGSEPDQLEAMGGRLYFVAFHPTSGRELWRSNGTLSGTSMIKNFVAGANSPSIGKITAMGNVVFFMVNNALWKSTGTYAGTTLVKTLSTEPGYNFGTNLTAINNWLYFTTGYELWLSDGTTAGTFSPALLQPGASPDFTLFNGNIYYIDDRFNEEEYRSYYHIMKMAPNGTGITEIWKTRVSNNYNETVPSFVPELAQANNVLYFYGLPNENEGHKLMKSDGTAKGTVILKDTYMPTISSFPNSFVNHNGLAYFKTKDVHETDRYIHRTDGTYAGTIKLKSFGEVIGDITPAGDLVFFNGLTESGDWQLWRSNGTTAGTLLMKQAPNSAWGFSYNTAAIGGTYLFSNQSEELWKSNGTVTGTTLIRSLPGLLSMTSDGTRAYLMVQPTPGVFELWKTNGTNSGTVKIQPLVPLSGFRTQYYLMPNSTINGITYFFGTDNYKGHEIWRTDGTATGTYRIGKIQMSTTTQFVSPIYWMTTFKGNLYFSTENASRESALFRTDGTTTGLVQIVTIPTIVQFIPLGDNLLLFPFRSHPTLSRPPVLWKTDGTTAGTVPIKSISGITIFSEVDYEVINGIAYFTSSPEILYTGYVMNNLWRTDGTECGTFLIQSGLTNIQSMEALGNTLILGGFADYVYGNELYRYNVSNAPASPCTTVAAGVSPEEVSVPGFEAELISTGPNPFSTDFSLRINSPDESAQLQVYTLNGKLVESNAVLPCNADLRMGQSWVPGLYVIKVRTGNIVATRKVIKR